ncbi:MAG: glycosyltransferase, partial [Lachnospiraceae bacterium]|nr:glycosyltransferase [Lachnospiraceae bacterium]
MSNQKLPLVSIVIPTYNRIHTLPASVDSVLKQTYENLELIIMDDGSTDGTEEYVKGITDERVRYSKADKNMGPSAAGNMGAEQAKGE